MSFPYISQIQVNNCFTYRDFSIPNSELKEFKHIILTGRNGSGKTTILNRVGFLVSKLQEGYSKHQLVSQLQRTISANPRHGSIKTWEQQIQQANDIDIKHLGSTDIYLKNHIEGYIFSFFKAHRQVKLRDVTTVTKEDEFLTNLKNQNKTEDFISQFKQYLVNKKIYEAFDYMNSKNDNISNSKIFFNRLTKTLRSIFKDEKLELEFIQETFEFYIQLGDQRRITFNQLSEGFSAFLSILMDLLMRTDLIRKIKNDYTLEPEGIVLIDEPETHFHLSMQYEMLPLLTKLFPNIQLIIATHSPAIISSVENSVVYDLSSKQEVSDWVLGSSYSELMIKHFGLDNEYSPIADRIILDINKAVKSKNVVELNKILNDNQTYLTPSLKIEIESQIIHLNNQL